MQDKLVKHFENASKLLEVDKKTSVASVKSVEVRGVAIETDVDGY